MIPASTPIARLASTLLALACLAGGISAAEVWVPLTLAAPPDTPAEIVLDEGASSATTSVIDILIHGFWVESVAPGDGNVYSRVRVPGLGRLAQEGAPDLPAARLRLAVSSGSPAAAVVATDLDPRVVPGVLPYPFVIEEVDEDFDLSFSVGPGDVDGTPAQFVRDDGIYLGVSPFPGLPAPTSVGVATTLGTIPTAQVEVVPARWDPDSGDFTISAHMRVTVLATGVPAVAPAMTRDRFAVAGSTFHNWNEQAPFFPADLTHFAGRYAILTSTAYLDALAPFITHVKLRGFTVDVLTLESLPSATCTHVRGALDTWYQAGDPFADHYALLVGDIDAIPQCPSPTSAPGRTDDLYGSPGDGDLDEEIVVGRLSVDDEDDLVRQLARIVGYDVEMGGLHHGRALLVAHHEGAPGKYEAAQDAVAAATYAQPPAFTTRYGSTGTSTAAVMADVDAGVGVMSYRGHSGPYAWTDWNTLGEDLHKNEILSLTNVAAPAVVWAFTCWTNRLDVGVGSVDSMGEAWLEHDAGGAVAHYGATNVTDTSQNDALDRLMFEAVFDAGLTRHGQAMAWAEGQMHDLEPGLNGWLYLLLGDPAMRIKQGQPLPFTLDLPEVVPVDGGGTPGATWSVKVLDTSGDPAPDVLVAVHKPGPPGEPDDLLLNGYTDGEGVVVFDDFPSDLAAPIDVSASDPFGNQTGGVTGVIQGVWSNLGGALPGQQGEPVLTGTGTLIPNDPFSIDLANARASSTSLFFGSIGSTPVPFKGGTLVAHPWTLLVPLVTDPGGAVNIVAPWPPGFPADSELWFQYAIQDAAAPFGVALSNGLRAITP